MEAFQPLLSHLRTPIFIGWLVILLVWESGAPFFDYFKARRRERLRHALRNLTVGLLNSALIALLFVTLWTAASHWAETHRFGLLNLGDPPAVLRVVLAILMLDLWTYWWHRLNHRVPLLWRFHRVHHSDPEMDVTTASRFHVGEMTLSSLLRIPLIALLGIRFGELVLYETILFAIVQFHHANIGLGERGDRLLRLFIVTPAMHKVHHSRLQPETDSNYTSLLSLWDRLFRTFRLRDDPRTIRIGLDEFDRPEDQTLRGMMKIPLAKNVRRSSASA
jgi:sterol desaturase/sphingolipid hydroxylase (fatty acid hydroxylase superfamily)